jgi:putative Ca2+/H+ antiporter (TMEM165/GDT1 family)
MDIRVFFTVFITVFLAELGDKTQLATMLFATDKAVSKWVVFVAASLALVLCSAIGVLAGDWLSQHVSARMLKTAAGAGFVVIGLWVLVRTT